MIIIGLTMPREILYQRINERVDQMFDAGLVNEVKQIYNKYGDVKALKAIGIRKLLSLSKGIMIKKKPSVCQEKYKTLCKAANDMVQT